MDASRFDELARRLATETSRRRLLAGIASGALGGALSALRSQRGVANDKVFICHLTGSTTNPVVLIEVSVNAIPAHQAHGDAIAPDFQSDPEHCGGCLISCDDGDPCTVDTCEAGRCVNTPIVCDDGNQCTDDRCVEGRCLSEVVVGRPCDDGNGCTRDDACNEAGQCAGIAIVCGGNGLCSVSQCNPESGECEVVPTPGAPCDDGDPCTENDHCAANGACVGTPIDCPPGRTCVDGTCVEPCGDGVICGLHCCAPRLEFCCTAGVEPECCIFGQERCDPQEGGCRPFPPSGPPTD
jgi:hypothetical protein